jgi:hypothetical protein
MPELWSTSPEIPRLDLDLIEMLMGSIMSRARGIFGRSRLS